MRNKIFWSYVILWLILNAFSLYFQSKQIDNFVNKISLSQNKFFLEHIISIRQWAKMHGEVYVPVTEKTQSTPHIKHPYRDIVRQDGKKLTLLNDSHMIRQLSDFGQEKTGIQFHMTSLNPIRPENKADYWETIALHSFETGSTYVHELSSIGDKVFYRYMEPIKFENNCLQCHKQQDYKTSNFLGGISVNIPSDKISAVSEQHRYYTYLVHAIICFIGLVLLSLLHKTGEKVTQKLERAKGKLRLVYVDPLTKLPNRRHYDIFLHREWKRALRHQYPLSMIMLDIDYFKFYNDSLGHPEGDQCLKIIANTLKKYFRRPEDLIARYGGEEFCAVASCNSEQIYKLAENLRKAVEKCGIKHPDSKVSDVVTISLGCATLVPNEQNEPEQLLHYADRALYLAKEKGRNRVEQYQTHKELYEPDEADTEAIKTSP